MNALSSSLLVFLIAAADGKPPPPRLPIGKDTTVVTGPIDKEGYIDYETALAERMGKGIKPEKNANALLFKAFGPKPEGAEMSAEFYKHLGIDAPPEKGDYFVSLGKYAREHLKLNQEEAEAVYDQQRRATQRPWAAEDYPHITAWLIVNEKPLAVVLEATKRPDYFNPLISRKNKDAPSNLLGALLPSVQKCRELAAALTARAMLRVREGKYDEAWQDLLACHRLARLVARGATLIEMLVGVAIDAIASNAELAFLESAKLTPKQIRDCLKDLQNLPPMPSLADRIDAGERFMFLDGAQMVRRGGVKMLEGLAGGVPPAPAPVVDQNLQQLDWAIVLRNGNRWYDRMAAALRVKDRAGREKEFDKIDAELKALKKALTDEGDLIKLLAKGPPDKAVAKAAGDVLISLLAPAVRKVQGAADRAEQIQRNLHVAFALAAYRAENKRYPEKLDALAPKYLAAVPGDVFSGKPIVYKPSEKGYLLYSVGQNGVDEEGRWYDDEPRGDDPRVRMPLPELKPRER